MEPLRTLLLAMLVIDLVFKAIVTAALTGMLGIRDVTGVSIAVELTAALAVPLVSFWVLALWRLAMPISIGLRALNATGRSGGPMSQLDLSDVVVPDFEAAASFDGTVITAAFSGNADLRTKDALEAFIKSLDGEAARLRVAEVCVDLRKLQFMNSSCFKALISWITVLEDRAVNAQYKICFLSNPAMHWQKRSLQALCCFAGELISVQA